MYQAVCSQKTEFKKSQVSLPSMMKIIPNLTTSSSIDCSEVAELMPLNEYLVILHKNSLITLFNTSSERYYRIENFLNSDLMSAQSLISSKNEINGGLSQLYVICVVKNRNLASELKCYLLDIYQQFNYLLNNSIDEDNDYEKEENVDPAYQLSVGKYEFVIDIFKDEHFYNKSFIEYDELNNIIITKDSMMTYKIWKLKSSFTRQPVNSQLLSQIAISQRSYVSGYSIHPHDYKGLVTLSFQLSDRSIADIRTTKELFIAIKHDSSIVFELFDISNGKLIISYSILADIQFKFELLEIFDTTLLIKQEYHFPALISMIDSKDVKKVDPSIINSYSIFIYIDGSQHFLSKQDDTIVFIDIRSGNTKRQIKNTLNEVESKNIQIFSQRKLIVLYWNSRGRNPDQSYIFSDNIKGARSSSVLDSEVISIHKPYSRDRLIYIESNEKGSRKAKFTSKSNSESIFSDSEKYSEESPFRSSATSHYNYFTPASKLAPKEKISVLKRNENQVEGNIKTENLLLGEFEIIDYSDLSFSTLKRISTMNSVVIIKPIGDLNEKINHAILADNDEKLNCIKVIKMKKIEEYDQVSSYVIMRGSCQLIAFTNSKNVIVIDVSS